MRHILKALSLIIVLFAGKTPGNSNASISCSATLPASNLSITYDIFQDVPVATNSAFSYRLKIPTLLSILTFSIGAAHYFGIYDMAAALLLTILGFIALDKVAAILFMASIAYSLKEPVLTALPFGTRILFHLKTAEHFFSSA